MRETEKRRTQVTEEHIRKRFKLFQMKIMYKQNLDISVKDGKRYRNEFILTKEKKKMNIHHTVEDGNRAIGVSS